MTVVTELTYLQRDVRCVIVVALYASWCIRHTELTYIVMTLGDDLRTEPVFRLCIWLEEVQVLSHFQTSAMEFYSSSVSGKFYRIFHGCSRF